MIYDHPFIIFAIKRRSYFTRARALRLRINFRGRTVALCSYRSANAHRDILSARESDIFYDTFPEAHNFSMDITEAKQRAFNIDEKPKTDTFQGNIHLSRGEGPWNAIVFTIS